MRLIVLFCSLLALVAASCSQGNCLNEDSTSGVQPGINRLISASRFWGKRAVPDELRKASLRWGKRSPRPSIQQIRESSRFWGKRDVPTSLRRASLRWGKRSEAIPDLMPAGDLMFPLGLVAPSSSEVQDQPVEVMERVAKAETLRPKLALSSRLWGR